MSKAYEEFKAYLDRAMALKTAMTLFEWDNETLAPKEAGELTSNVIGTLSGEYFQAITNDRMKALVKELQAEQGLDEVQAANVREVADFLPVAAADLNSGHTLGTFDADNFHLTVVLTVQRTDSGSERIPVAVCIQRHRGALKHGGFGGGIQGQSPGHEPLQIRNFQT